MKYSAVDSLRAWVPALTLGASAFIFVTAEMLPVGLLPDIALSLGENEAATGLLLTIYAWGVALLGIPLTLLSARFDRRRLVLTLFAIFICGNALSAFAGTLAVLMAARICVAMAHSVFWAIVPPLTMRVAPEGGKARALGITVTGISLATVLGVPLGTLLGHYLGWRFAFGTVAALAFGIAVVLGLLLPSSPTKNAGSLSSLSGIARNRPLLRLYGLTLLTATGHFATFTYFAPFMQSVGGFDSRMVAVLLLALGAAGLFGSIAGSRLVETPGRKPIVIPLLGLSVLFALMPFAATGGAAPVFVIMFLWGALYTFISMALQLRVIVSSPDSADLSTAIFSGSFNVGVGLGAFTGSYVFSLLGIACTPYAGAAFLLAAAVIGSLPGGAKPE